MCRRVSGLYLSGAATRLEKHSDQLYSYVSAFCLCIFVLILIRRILYARQDVGSTMCSIERRIRWVSYSNYIALFDVVQCLRWAHLCHKVFVPINHPFVNPVCGCELTHDKCASSFTHTAVLFCIDVALKTCLK